MTTEILEDQQAATEEETLEVPLAELRPALEAVLMVADQPLDDATLATAVGYPVPEVVEALTALAEEYDESERGFELRNVAGGWRYYTREAFAPVVERFVLDGQQARLTQAALETLAVVAYKQPVSRSRVSAIRGVNVDGVMRTLLTRGLVEEAGTDHETGAHLYRTSSYFLERIGVSSLDDLPELAPLLPGMDDFDDEQEVVSAADPRGVGRSPRPTAWRNEAGRDRRRGPDPPAEAPGPVGGGQPAQVRGADARGAGRGRRRGGHPARHQGRPAHRADPGRGTSAAAGQRARLPGPEQAARCGLDDVGPAGAADAHRLRRRPARAALPRRPARHRHRRADPADQRRRVREPDGAPVVRGGQDVRRRGRRRGREGHASGSSGTASRSTTDPSRSARRRCVPRTATAPSSSWSSTRDATGSCAG